MPFFLGLRRQLEEDIPLVGLEVWKGSGGGEVIEEGEVDLRLIERGGGVHGYLSFFFSFSFLFSFRFGEARKSCPYI